MRLCWGWADPAQMTKGLESAAAAGIPVFGLDAGVADNVALNITCAMSQLGAGNQKYLAEALGGEGNVVMFTHHPPWGVMALQKPATSSGIPWHVHRHRKETYRSAWPS